ncbi:putative F-box protein PP2-B12 [Rhododendron vialii]|uniref:putative F-box protein PP2-B12 n=1 Tax=Rhododendron vialii TaxID=182163 RepID=UPI00265F6F97|nr:putative F-box protein PP2-B12 [Rhododendron vialii]
MGRNPHVERERERRIDNFSALPEGCISQILSMASPRDACRSSAISPLFKSAADSDGVWEKFLPSNYRQIISRSVSPVVFPTKKHLYLSLCDSPLLLDGGKLSFALDRESRKKCCTLPARGLKIAQKDKPRYRKWISLPDSRFSEVAQFLLVPWLDIWGRINTAMLSANTTYAAYLIFKITDHCGLKSLQGKSSVRLVKELEDGYPDDLSCTVYLTLGTVRSLPREQNGRLPQMRRDGWMEIELGEFYNDEGDEGEVEMRLKKVRRSKIGRIEKGRLIVEGIEVRPKDIA